MQLAAAFIACPARPPPAAQIAQVPAVSNSATSPLNPATQTTVNNTVPNAGNATGNVKEENSKSIDIQLSKEEMAAYLGISVRTLNRSLKNMKL